MMLGFSGVISFWSVIPYSRQFSVSIMAGAATMKVLLCAEDPVWIRNNLTWAPRVDADWAVTWKCGWRGLLATVL